ncbi:MAG: NmrA/HSCARG family protein [Fimbriimonadaceae bacterium]|nr:NmrA/HSCARG family protein [Fimbriimonadaceae bacterium]
MSDKKVIAVIGATGTQGGGLVAALLEDPEGPFVARAITRNPESAKAKELTANGVEVVAADLDDVESLKRAFSGAYGAYGVTNFWEHFSPEKELSQARNLAVAAKASGIQHFVWSTLEDTRKWVPLDSDQMPTLMDKYKVPHFDAKGESDAIFRELGVPTTFLLTSFYWDNFIHSGMGPQRGPDGKLAIAFPMDDKKLPGIAAEDIGRCAYGVFKEGPKLIGQTIGIAGDHLSGPEIAESLSRAMGEHIGFHAISATDYRGLGFPGADDLGNMFQFKRDFNDDFRAARSVERARELNPKLQSFAEWAAKHNEEVPVP